MFYSILVFIAFEVYKFTCFQIKHALLTSFLKGFGWLWSNMEFLTTFLKKLEILHTQKPVYVTYTFNMNSSSQSATQCAFKFLNFSLFDFYLVNSIKQ